MISSTGRSRLIQIWPTNRYRRQKRVPNSKASCAAIVSFYSVLDYYHIETGQENNELRIGTKCALNDLEPPKTKENLMPKSLANSITAEIRKLISSFRLPNEVLVEARDNVVTLRGTVESFYQKQLCFSAVNATASNHRLVDELKVDWR